MTADNSKLGHSKIVDCEELKETLRLTRKEWEWTFNSLPDLITILDNNHRVIKVNKAMAERVNLRAEDLKGKQCYEAVHGTDCPIDNCPHSLLLSDGVEHTSEVQEDNLGGYFLVTATPIIDEGGNVKGSVHVARDITKRIEMENALKVALEDKDVLMMEIHHRVKNNLMIMSSLLNLQSNYIDDEKTLNVFRDSQNRAKAMALIHQKLYQSTDLKHIDFGDYIENLTSQLYQSMVMDSDRIKLEFDVEDIKIDLNMVVPLGLIVNELVTNSIKHAFLRDEGGTIKLEFHRDDENIILRVSDNGAGFPEDMDYKNADSLGLKLVNTLSRQINGELTLDESEGTAFTLVFKEM